MKKIYVNQIGKIRVCDEGMFIDIERQYIAALKALDGFSHLNIIWWFDGYDNEETRSVLDVQKPYKNGPDTKGKL